jgi:tetratricopeptide (TPR) repeat protein
LTHGGVSVATADIGDERARELFIRGSSLLHSNDRREFEEAQALLDRAVGRDPRFSRAIAARGYTRWRQYFAGWANSDAALTGAFRDVDAALGINPDSVSAHMTYIRACWDKGWHERALAAGRAIYTRNPESLEAANAYARALMNAGIAQCALPLAASVLEEDPANPSSLKLTIWCLLMLGDHQSAADAASRYLPGHPADANTRWAAAMANQRLPGGGPGAIQIARDGLTAEPGDVTLWVLLGYLYRLNGDEGSAVLAWSDGLAHVEQQLGDGPNYRFASWVANLHAAVGNQDAARSSVHALLNADPHNGYLRYRLSHVLAELGDADGAVQMFGEAVGCGFLSYQLARQEETLAFARVASAPGYAAAFRQLLSNVERMCTAYAPILPTAAMGSHDQSYGDGK